MELELTVIIPVYNSADTLAGVTDRLLPVLAKITPRFEVILVNDGSKDQSWAAISDLASRFDSIVGLDLMRNYGQQNAILAGVMHARGELVVTMDDDLQYPPEEIPKLLEGIEQGYDVVYGRPEKRSHGLFRNLASDLTKEVLKRAMGIDLAPDIGPFRAFRTELREAFREYRNPYVSLDVLLSWGTSKFSAVAVQHNERQHGKSSYTFTKLVLHTLNMITGFSTLPLRVASLIGFGMTAFGGLVLVYVLGKYLIYGVVLPGFVFLASVIAIFSGAQLFALGIIGEYLARIYLGSISQPSFVVKTSTAGELKNSTHVGSVRVVGDGI